MDTNGARILLEEELQPLAVVRASSVVVLSQADSGPIPVPHNIWKIVSDKSPILGKRASMSSSQQSDEARVSYWADIRDLLVCHTFVEYIQILSKKRLSTFEVRRMRRLQLSLSNHSPQN